MQKIISLFQRNYETDRLVRDEVVPGAEWVLAGEGMPTLKYDGVCTMVRGGVLYKRYELKPGKTAPPNWEPADERDETTGKQMGWVPVGDGPEDAYMREAFEDYKQKMTGHPDWERTMTCEFLGPKSQGNIENVPQHILLPHEYAQPLAGVPRDYAGIKAYLAENPEIEGIVWHHEDGRMVKIKGKDFGIKRVKREYETVG